MPQFQVNAKIIENNKLGEGIYRITLEAPDIANAAKPGQFVMVKASDALDPLLRRPFSIHQVIDKKSIQILLKVVGKGTKIVSGGEVGQLVDIIGPLGKGFDIDRHNFCLIGGGIGVAPLLYLAKMIVRAPSPRKIVAIIGARTCDELSAITRGFEDLGIQLLLATDDGSKGIRGPVTGLMNELKGKEIDWTVYSCGPRPMLKAVADICRENGWECQVSMETMMACGVAACLGCAIESSSEDSSYFHTCKDGPVFDARKLKWI